MASRIGGFKSPEARDAYHQIYDRFLDNHWPVERVELDVETQFGTTHVRRSGTAQGTPLVLVHPTSGSSLGWARIIQALSKQHTVYTPDTIGTIGRSVQTAPIRSSRDLVDWLDQVLEGLEVGPVHLVGYSEGGWIAGIFAAVSDRPERLVSLTLVEPAGAVEKVPSATLAEMILRAGRTLTSKNKPQAIRDFNHWMNGDVQLSDDEIELVLFAFQSFQQRLPTPSRLSDDQLRRISMPTLLLLAGSSRILSPVKVSSRAARLMPDVQIDVIPDTGHGLWFQHPDQISERVLAFIEQTSHEEPIPPPPLP